MRKSGWIIVSLVVLITIGTTCYFLFASEKENPQVTEYKEKLKEINEKNLSHDEMRSEMRKLHEKTRELPEETRQEIRRATREIFRKRMEQQMNQRMDAYFNAPPAKKNEILDKQIYEMEARMKQFAARRAEWQRTHAQRNNRSSGNQTANRSGNGSRGSDSANAQANNQRHHRRRPRTEEERVQRRKDRMERRDPRARARWSEYRNAMRKRRKELGLPEMSWHRGRGRRPR